MEITNEFEEDYYYRLPKDVDYTINSMPRDITFNCPYCDKSVSIDFRNEFWESGEIVECPECGREVYLNNWEYD